MKKIVRNLLVLAVSAIMVLSSGCSIPFIGDDSKSEVTDENNVTSENSSVTKKVKKLVSDYYKALFAESIEKYNTTSKIPDNIKGFIAKRTLTEGDNNPEVGIHLPRYVEMNGMTIIKYGIVKGGKDDGIEATYIGKSGDELLYYTKVHLMVDCINDTDFYSNYKLNTTTRLFEKQNVNIDEAKVDSFRVIASYDINVVKEGSEYKVLRATEASVRPGYQNRVLTINNDFMQRNPYINVEKAEGSKEFINKEDGKKFESDTRVMEEFFKNLKIVDNERMNLLKSKWNIGQKEFTDYVSEVLKINVDNNKKQIVQIDDKYKSKLSIDAFPLKVNMNKMVKITNFTITPHPAYTKKQNRYIMGFDAYVELSNGIIGQQTKFRYDYFVTMNGDVKLPKITGIYLNSVNVLASSGDSNTQENTSAN
jgi:hypothetical protein